MSMETMTWLNTMTLVGFTDKRGNAWHYRANAQGELSNHYPGAIPVEDVEKRLFNFSVVELPLFMQLPNGTFKAMPSGRKAMVTDDTWEDLGVFKDGYQGHQYKQWLVDNVSTILKDDLAIGSAGLLRNRGVAWVQIEVPENFKTPEGVEFRPNLLATTSFDGTVATTYKRTITVVVCDNTLQAARGEAGQAFKVKHTRFSNLKLTDAREALGIIHTAAEDFEAEVKELCEWDVSDAQFQKFLSTLIPPVADEGRAKTMADKKRSEIETLYLTDQRAAPWQGTAFGVLQATNTYNHHVANIRGEATRAVRNMENVVSGKFAQSDTETLSVLAKVCERV